MRSRSFMGNLLLHSKTIWLVYVKCTFYQKSFSVFTSIKWQKSTMTEAHESTWPSEQSSQSQRAIDRGQSYDSQLSNHKSVRMWKLWLCEYDGWSVWTCFKELCYSYCTTGHSMRNSSLQTEQGYLQLCAWIHMFNEQTITPLDWPVVITRYQHFQRRKQRNL